MRIAGSVFDLGEYGKPQGPDPEEVERELAVMNLEDLKKELRVALGQFDKTRRQMCKKSVRSALTTTMMHRSGPDRRAGLATSRFPSA